MDATDVVVLVPGFLGFARFGGFYYFADRVVAVLRGFLEEAIDRPVQVVPVSTLPTDSLRNRQEFLLVHLCELLTEKLPGVKRVHLVGHSTGGVDVQLLGCTNDLDGHAWNDMASHVRSKLSSVVTISAPHHGTGLADSQLARFAEHPLENPWGALQLLATLKDLAAVLPLDAAALAGFAVSRPSDVLRFLLQIVRHRRLIHDLRATSMAEIRSRTEQDAHIPLTCFVTGTTLRDEGRPSDLFYRDLYRLTATGDDGTNVSSEVKRNEKLLTSVVTKSRADVIASADGVVPPSVDTALNDGIVNSARQLVQADLAQLGGFVVADHGDVLGHYDRQDSLIEGKPYNAGLFHSGASFGDDQFFELYRRVAAGILRAIPGSGACAARSWASAG